MLLVHYGHKSYRPDKFKQIENNWPPDRRRKKNGIGIKPIGGLWASPVSTNWGWKEWCIENEFKSQEYFSKSFMFRIRRGAKLFVIDKYTDLILLPWIETGLSFLHAIDFEKLGIEYDAIHLTERGCEETHLSQPLNLYGWDCESVLILNKSVILPKKAKLT